MLPGRLEEQQGGQSGWSREGGRAAGAGYHIMGHCKDFGFCTRGWEVRSHSEVRVLVRVFRIQSKQRVQVGALRQELGWPI